jgi:hypothetical protein
MGMRKLSCFLVNKMVISSIFLFNHDQTLEFFFKDKKGTHVPNFELTKPQTARFDTRMLKKSLQHPKRQQT